MTFVKRQLLTALGLNEALAGKLSTASTLASFADGGGFVRMTDAERAKLAALSDNFKGAYADLAALATAHPSADAGDWAVLTHGSGANATIAAWDSDAITPAWVDTGLGGEKLLELWVRGADIASAATLNLNNATGDYVAITGTTTITAITLADGREVTCRFTSTPTLTHGASLILPTSANIVAIAGDVAVFRGEAGGVVRCVHYQRANGAALAMVSATEAVKGAVELATSAETTTGTDTVRATHPAGVTAMFAGRGEITIRAKDMTPRTTSGAAFYSIEGATYKTMVVGYLFDAAVVEYLDAIVTLPPDYTGGDLNVCFSWTAAAASGSVRWGAAAAFIVDGDLADQELSAPQYVVDATTGALKHNTSGWTPGIVVRGGPYTRASGARTRIRLGVLRDAADASDTLAGDAQLLDVTISYPVDLPPAKFTIA